MGLFSTSSPFDADVEKATDEKNISEEWGRIMDICDKVGSSSQNAKDCLRSIVKRLNHQDPHIQMQAVTLLDACANNCGKNFLLEIASRDFETEYRKLLSRCQPRVNEKLRQLLKKWAETDFKTDPQLGLIPSLYAKLRQEGTNFSTAHAEPYPRKPEPVSRDPNVVSSQQEQDDILKAIELSLKETSTSPGRTQSSLYPSTSLSQPSATANVEARKVRALYDFEAAEDNELTFALGEIIHVVDDSDPNWWKGYNYKGEGLFPSNFVTADLSAEPEKLFKLDQPKKNVQFNESVQVKTVEEPQEVEINELKIDRLLHLLHEADPTEDHSDTEEMLAAEEQVNAMGPLIDQELERVDRKHAQLTQLSSDLVEAFNLYHTLMREPGNTQTYHTMQHKPPMPYGYATQPGTQPHPIYNGTTSYPGQPYSMPPEQYGGQPIPQYHMGGPGPGPPRPEDHRLPPASGGQQGPMGYPPGPGYGPLPPQSFPHPGSSQPGQGATSTALHYSPSGRLL